MIIIEWKALPTSIPSMASTLVFILLMSCGHCVTSIFYSFLLLDNHVSHALSLVDERQSLIAFSAHISFYG